VCRNISAYPGELKPVLSLSVAWIIKAFEENMVETGGAVKADFR
jgi:hypothetical protein